jgi:hypothetical protein
MVSRVAASAAALALLFAGCASIPGETREEQASHIDALLERTLQDLYRQYPETEKEVTESVGYVILNNKLTKIPVFGAGAGHGAAVDTGSGQKTYLILRRLDFGAGWGARSVRPVLIFQDEKKFREFIDGDFEASMGAEASAKVGDTGAAGGAGGGNRSGSRGYSMYVLTDAGVSATFSAAIVRVKPVRLKK